MRFNRIRLSGFKGFAEPTDIAIDDGLTGIVGPNGCGKSNIVEAIGWVMGENRPTALRGEAMDSVIFAGTATRPPRAHAEVVLEIEPEEGASVMEVSRRIDRSGSSVFRCDGREMRLRDINILFCDNASGPRSPALVRQGQISDLVNARPLTRAGILEGAAGIAGLAQRRREAELRLNATDGNLTRVTDILDQLEERMNALARQARQARRYRQLGDRIRNAQALLDYLRWRAVDDHALAAQGCLDQAIADVASRQSAELATDHARNESEQALAPLRDTAAAAGAALQRLCAERDLATDQSRRARDAAKTLASRIEQLEHDIQRETDLRSEADKIIASLERQNRVLGAEGEEFAETLATSESGLAAAEEALERLEAAHAIASARAGELASQRTMAHGALADAERRESESEDRQRAAEDAMRAARERLEETQAVHDAARQACEEASDRANQAERELSAFEAARVAARRAAADAERILAESDERLAVLRSEAEELERLLSRGGVDESSALGTLSVEDGLEVALGAALGGDLFAPKANGEGSGWTELPAFETAPTLPLGVEPLTAYVDGPAYLARRLSQTGLADPERFEEVRTMLRPGQRVVTRSGYLCRWDGFAAEGSDTTAALRLGQLNRLREVRSEIDDAAESAATAQTTRDALQEKADGADAAESDARTARMALDDTLARCRASLTHAESEAAIAHSRSEDCKKARDEALAERNAARDALSRARSAISDVAESEPIANDAEHARKDAAAARTRMLDMRAARDGLLRDHSERTDRLAHNDREVSQWRERSDSAHRRIEELQQRLDESTLAHKTAQEETSNLGGRQDGLAERIEEADRLHQEAATALAEAEVTQRDCRQAAIAAAGLANTAREEKARLEARLDGAIKAREAAERDVRERHQCTPTDLAQQLSFDRDNPPDIARQEIDVDRLTRSRDAMGAVNLRAEQDIDLLKTDYQTLRDERDDLEAAVRDLRSNIARLNDDGRQRLRQQFESVDRYFGELFVTLFGGGSARLELIEGEDPLESGLEILCHPPGKRFSTLSLLSGGEQTLTAIALTFALFMTAPAPICVLDEVDASLDDANVGRFCDLVEEVARRSGTRFLIVTHHPITMARMDRLLGVTMQERGVSRIVSVDLGEAERLAA